MTIVTTTAGAIMTIVHNNSLTPILVSAVTTFLGTLRQDHVAAVMYLDRGTYRVRCSNLHNRRGL